MTNWQQHDTADMHELQPVLTLLKAEASKDSPPAVVSALPAQVGKDHLKEEDAHTVHVKLVWVVETPQDGRQEGRHWQGGRPGGLHADNNCNNHVWALLLMIS